MSRAKQTFAEHLLNNMTWPERILWSRLRHRQIGYSFQRQEPIRGYIVDFWCAEAKVAVELDGPVHDTDEKREHDRIRDAFLSRCGIKVLRFRNSDVKRGMSAVLIRIWDECNARDPKTVKPFSLKGSGVTSRHENTLEIRGLRAFQQDTRLKTHEQNFSRRYWEKRRLSVGNHQK